MEETHDYQFDVPFEEQGPYSELIHGETVFLDGFLYDVYVEQHPDGSIELSINPRFYTCWDGTIPF